VSPGGVVELNMGFSLFPKTVKFYDESEMLLILALGEIYEYNINRPEIVLDVLFRAFGDRFPRWTTC
jgi:hypothetical protein